MGHLQPDPIAARRVVSGALGRSAVVLLLAAASAWGSAVAGSPELKGAWMRPVPAGAELARAYVDIVSDVALELAGASTPLAQQVELVAVPVYSNPEAETLVATLPVTQGTTRLAYRGNHLRLTGIRRDAGNGDRIPLTLRFRDAAGKEVTSSTEILVRGILTPRQVPAADKMRTDQAPAAGASNPAAAGMSKTAPIAPNAPTAPMQPAQPRM